jgi:hypothetical protein
MMGALYFNSSFGQPSAGRQGTDCSFQSGPNASAARSPASISELHADNSFSVGGGMSMVHLGRMAGNSTATQLDVMKTRKFQLKNVANVKYALLKLMCSVGLQLLALECLGSGLQTDPLLNAGGRRTYLPANLARQRII